jgi:hypothetical protein
VDKFEKSFETLLYQFIKISMVIFQDAWDCSVEFSHEQAFKFDNLARFFILLFKSLLKRIKILISKKLQMDGATKSFSRSCQSDRFLILTVALAVPVYFGSFIMTQHI